MPSDAEFVAGVARHDDVVVRALYRHLRRYFEDNYRGLFFTKDDYDKDEILQQSFITLWEHIERGDVYVEDGVLRGRDGEVWRGRLTTYFMSIARFKYLELTRSASTDLSFDDHDGGESTLFGHLSADAPDEAEELRYRILAECVSHMSARCNQILTRFYYEEKTLDTILIELPTFMSKDALKTAKNKCMNTLRQAANDMYKRHISL